MQPHITGCCKSTEHFSDTQHLQTYCCSFLLEFQSNYNALLYMLRLAAYFPPLVLYLHETEMTSRYA